MALFDDGPASSISDLSAHDTQLLDVASTEGIDVTCKLALAQEEIAGELTTLLARLNGTTATWAGSGPCRGQVVVTPPLRQWHTFLTLELVYRDAYQSQLNDRYAGKRDEYHELAGWAYEKLIQNGIGIVQNPLRRAAQPILAVKPGAVADGTYYVSISWTNGAHEEGAASLPCTITTSGSTFSVTPSGAPKQAEGWNVYAGISPQSMTLQNSNPLAPGVSWTQPNALNTTGRPAGTGQVPNLMRQTPRILQRG